MDINSIAGILFGLGFFLLILTAMILLYLNGNREHKERLAKIQKQSNQPTSHDWGIWWETWSVEIAAERASLMKSRARKKTKRPYRRILKKVR